MKGIKARISISRESDICQIGQGWVSDWDILVLYHLLSMMQSIYRIVYTQITPFGTIHLLGHTLRDN